MNKGYNPVVDFVYFASVIGFGMLLAHPVCIAISFLSGFVHLCMLKKKNRYIVWLMLVTAVLNPIFNHAGVTVLCYLPGGNPLTAESVIYGAASAAMLGAVILHFSCFNELVTSDKLIYLFGKVMPTFSLMLSTALRFVPYFSKQIRQTAAAKKAAGRVRNETNFFNKAKNSIDVLSAVITQSLENAMDTADSMRGRGYGLAGRTAYSIFKFEKRDKKALAVLLFLTATTVAASFFGCFYFNYYPMLRAAAFSPENIFAMTGYALLCFAPIISGIEEELKWKKLKSKN